MPAALSPAVFLERDGTLIEDTGYIRDPLAVRLFPDVAEGLATLRAHGFKTVIVTNQSGIGRGYFTEADYRAVHGRLVELLAPGAIDAVYFCAEHPDTASERRKPGPGMLLEAAADLSLDLSRSWMIGDRVGDIEAGRRAGCRTILLRTGEGMKADASGADY